VSAPSRWHYCVLQVLSLKPGDFPLLSNRSRAAARATVLGRRRTLERCEVILGCSAQKCSVPHTSEWREGSKGRTMVRVVSIPEGMTLEQGLRVLDGFSEKERAQAAELCPEPLQLGTMLMMRR
jgi:hypothetical protein